MKMLVRNEFLGCDILVCFHAQTRFYQRSSGNMAKRLAAALPFGAQFGESLMLRDEDVVFVSARHPIHKRCIVTVLTLEQAVVNMQQRGIRMDVGKVPAASPPEPKKVDISEVNRLCQLAANMATIDDEQIAALVEESLAVNATGSDGKRLRAARKAFQEEHGKRNRFQKQKEHAQRMEAEREALRLAIRELLPFDKEMQVLARAAKLVEQDRSEWPRHPMRSNFAEALKAASESLELEAQPCDV